MLIDLSAGNLGFALPAAGIVLFYFGLVGSFPRAAAAAAGYGLVLDLIYGRPYPVSALVLPVALAAGAALQHRIDSYLLDAAPPGAAGGFHGDTRQHAGRLAALRPRPRNRTADLAAALQQRDGSGGTAGGHSASG